MEKYKVSYFSNPKTIEVVELEKKQPIGKQVLIKIDFCAICTLEQRVYNGVMKYYPFAGGHEAAGIVESVGSEVKGVKVGDKVAIRLLNSCGECYYCRSGNENQCVESFAAKTHEGIGGPGGISEYMVIDAKNVYKMNDTANIAHASLTEPLACCIHSIRKGKIQLGDDVVVIGCGIMGALHIQLAKLSGARVIACEVDDDRLEVARQMGANVLVNSKDENTIDRVKELTDGRGADAVFCTVAISAIASDAIAMTGKVGRTIFYSSFHPDNPVEISPNKIHSSEQIITGAVNPKEVDFLTATKMISNGIVDLSKLISNEIPFSEIDRAFEEAIDPKTYRILIKL